MDAVRPESGPAAKESKQREAEFEQELGKIAPGQNPDGENWVLGNAPSQALSWAVESVCKACTISIVGVYPEQSKTFPIGQAMNKNLTMRMGNCHHRRYIPRLIGLVQSGAVDPSKVLTGREPLTEVIEAYKALDTRQPGWIKVELKPSGRAAGA